MRETILPDPCYNQPNMPRPKSDRKMEKIVISITEPQKEWLNGEAERLGISPAELVRRVLDDYRGESLRSATKTEE